MNEADKKVVDKMVTEFNRYESYHKDRFDEAEDIIDKWSCEAPTRDEEWQNAVSVPLILEAEQTITPRIFTALYPTDAPLDMKCEGDTPEIDGIIIKGLIQHYFRLANVRGKSFQMLMQNTLLGTAYAEAGMWLLRRGYAIGEGNSRILKIIANRPDFNPVDFFEIYPHPYKLEVEDPLPVMRRRYIDAETLKSFGENSYFGYRNVQEALDSKTSYPKDAAANEQHEYELIEYFGPYDYEWLERQDKVNIQKSVPFWNMIINRQVLVRSIPNPFNHQRAPFVKINLFPDVKPSWFGVGVGKIGLPTQERIEKIVNQRLDNVDLVLNKMGLYAGTDTILNPKQLGLSKPGKWIKVADTATSVKWLDTPDVTASSYREEDLAKRDFRESVGATSPMMPTDNVDEQHRTAMGIQLLQGAAGMRFKPVLTKIEQDLISGTADFFLHNCKQFMTTKEWVEIMGEGASKMIEVTPDQIQRKVRFIPTGISETVNKEVQISQLLRFKEVTAQDPTVNRAEINKRIAELFGFKDLNKIVIQQQAPPQGSGSGLSPEQENMIIQRMREGASPDQIKMEMLGAPPSEGEQAPQQMTGGA